MVKILLCNLQALAKANQAKNSAQDSSEKVGDALKTVDDILEKLGNVKIRLRPVFD